MIKKNKIDLLFKSFLSFILYHLLRWIIDIIYITNCRPISIAGLYTRIFTWNSQVCIFLERIV
jgi:hypothetical protein